MSGGGRELPAMAQMEFELGSACEDAPGVVVREAVSDEFFLDADRTDLFFGKQRIDRYLSEHGLGWVLRLRSLLRAQDYTQFKRQYCCTGRKAIHPSNLLGVVVYGVIKGQTSLRQMEELAVSDVGAMWVVGLYQPDHSTIGKFLQLHSETLSEEFFTALLKDLLGRMHLGRGVVAGDATVVEAAASRFRMIKAEVAQALAQEADQAAAQDPADQGLARKAQAAQALRELADQRRAQRAAWTAKGDSPKLALSEPEAVNQPLKSGAPRPSYKPAIMVHEAGLIVAQHVAPSSERSSIKPMLDQHQAAFAATPKALLLDAGYPSFALFAQLCEMEIDVLAPSGRTDKTGAWLRRGRGGLFAKARFKYDPARDVYRCPAGKELHPLGKPRVDHSGAFRRYRAKDCERCELRSQCTTSSQGRMLNRYRGDELMEAMQQVLAQPAARKLYRRRSALVEPVFARLGLKRFRRRGLSRVRLEFALHCIAYNLKRAVGASSAQVWFILWMRCAGPITRWRPLLALRFTP